MVARLAWVVALWGLTGCPEKQLSVDCQVSAVAESCPPGTAPFATEKGQAGCDAEGEVKDASGAVSASCFASEQCEVRCDFNVACECGVDVITKEFLRCAACTTACGNGACEPGESAAGCPEDCGGGRCDPGESRCQGDVRQICNNKGIFETVPCHAGAVCVEEGGAASCVCSPDCEERECGDDGCGGSCGACDDGVACTEDACQDGQCGVDASACECASGADCVTSACREAPSCDETLSCVAGAALADGTACLVGDQCAAYWACASGECAETEAVPTPWSALFETAEGWESTSIQAMASFLEFGMTFVGSGAYQGTPGTTFLQVEGVFTPLGQGVPSSVARRPDGRLVVVGSTFVGFGTPTIFWVRLIGDQAEVEHELTSFGFIGNDRVMPEQVVALSSNQFVLGGSREMLSLSGEVVGYDIWLGKYPADATNGQLVQGSFAMPVPGAVQCDAMVATPTDGVALACVDFDGTASLTWLNASFGEVFAGALDLGEGAWMDAGPRVGVTPGGALLVAGKRTREEDGAVKRDIWAARYDDGVQTWATTFSEGSDAPTVTAAAGLGDGTFLVAAGSDAGRQLTRLSAGGEVLWQSAPGAFTGQGLVQEIVDIDKGAAILGLHVGPLVDGEAGLMMVPCDGALMLPEAP